MFVRFVLVRYALIRVLTQFWFLVRHKVFLSSLHNSRESYSLYLTPGFWCSCCDSVGVVKLALCGDIILMLQMFDFIPSGFQLRLFLGCLISASGITQAVFQRKILYFVSRESHSCLCVAVGLKQEEI